MNIWLTTYLSTDCIARNGAAQLRMLQSFFSNGFSGTILRANEITRPDYPAHKQLEYGFKAACIKEAMDNKADIVIWADSNMVLLKPFTELLKVIDENPIFLMRNAWNVGQWSIPQSLQFFGVTRQQAFNIPTVVSGFFAIDLNKEPDFAEDFIRFCSKPEVINGPRTVKMPDSHSNDYYGHRHDQVILSLMAHLGNVKLTDSYYADPTNAVGHHEPIPKTEKTIILWNPC